MAVITIYGTEGLSGVTLTAPAAGVTLNGFLSANPRAAVSRNTPASGINLTSVGFLNGDNTQNVFRITNGTGTATNFMLTGYGTNYSQTFNLAGNSELFVVISGVGRPTAILEGGGVTIRKAPSDSAFQYTGVSSDIGTANNFNIIGTGENDSLTGGALADTISGGNGDDTLNGDAGNDTLNGGNGNDDINGGAGNDIVNGDDGNDILRGPGGNDNLNGGIGEDTLIGGVGNDTLTGGADRDRFRLNNQGVDTITDFSAGNLQDIFLISSFAYAGVPSSGEGNIVSPPINNTLTNNSILVGTTVEIAAVTLGAARFAYNTTTNQLIFDSDGDFSAGQTIVANVTIASGTLANNNFVFVA